MSTRTVDQHSLPDSSRFPAPAQVTIRFDVLQQEMDVSLERIRFFQKECRISEAFARVLVARGFTSAEDVKRFLSPNFRDHLPDPKTVKNILPAADIVLDAVKDGDSITVYGDFDVDGLSASAQLYLALKQMGAKVRTYIPSRFTEGYGLVSSAVQKLAVLGTDLLITVDCGISSIEELKLARSLGMKTIVIDHHQPSELPDADAIVNPAQPGCPFQEYRLAAAGLTWLFLIVLRQRLRERCEEFPSVISPEPKEFLDLAVLGTICDMVPLTSLNRLIAFRGLEALRSTQKIGLVALCDVAGFQSRANLKAGNVGFAIGPRINAAGRMSDAADVVELLTTNNSDRARKLAQILDSLNAKRRSAEEDIRGACLRQVQQTPGLLDEPAFVLFDESFHVGVIGIAAQRVVERHYRPVAVLAPAEEGTAHDPESLVKGSVRSIPGFHVAEVLSVLREHLVSGGGHAEAGGFSVRRRDIEAFRLAFVEEARRRLTSNDLQRRKTADVELDLAEVTFSLCEELEKMGPLGMGNPAPLFVARKVSVDSISPMGSGHARVRIRQGRVFHQAVAWGWFGHPLLRQGDTVDIAFHVEARTYQGLTSLQLELKEIWKP